MVDSHLNPIPEAGQLTLAERAAGRNDLHHDAVLHQAALRLELLVAVALELGEAVVLRCAQALTSGELVLGAAHLSRPRCGADGGSRGGAEAPEIVPRESGDRC